MGFFSEPVAGKVPQVTAFFWIIKVLATTVGETFADFLNEDAGLGLGGTSLVMLAIFLVSFTAQIRLTFYLPPLYWFVIVAISTVGTLLTDNLTDGLGVSLEITTPIAAAVLIVVFAGWYWSERDLSIHTIFTRRREAWYWLTVLVTFALGTAAGDLIAEQLDIGYGNSMLLFAGCIVVAGMLWHFNKINSVAGFWFVYVLTRPLGASIGDLLSQDPAVAGSGSEDLPPGWKAGLNLGTTATSMIFLGLIALLVVYLTFSKKDRLRNSAIHPGIGSDATNAKPQEAQ